MRTVHRWLVVTLVALVIFTLQPAGAFATPNRDRNDSASERDSSRHFPSTTELIVRFTPESTDDNAASRLTERESDRLIDRLTRDKDRQLQSSRALAGNSNLHLLRFESPEAASEALDELLEDPAVASVEPNFTRELHWVPSDEEHFADQQDWVETMRLPDAWNITTGDPELVVAVIDSGVSPTHPDIADKLVPGYNAIDGSDNSVDIEGHGTRVAGIIAAAGDNQVGTAGVAMDVKIMPIRVLADDRTISVASIHDAIVWAVDNGADVLNLSLGSDKASETERAAVQYAYQHDVPVIASSGNNFNRISYPASYPEAIGVGSLDANGNRSRFSSILSSVDVAAPGELLFSPAWDPKIGDYWDDYWANGRKVEGTSFSAAIVSGVVALQKSINPGLTVEQVREILTSTAIDTGDPGPESGVGAGQVDGEAAVRTVAFWEMYETWYPTDYPVTTGAVSRTWLWGTDPPSGHAYEKYAEAQHGVRLVYYYDKSRMEITYPLTDRDEQWYVTNGLLVNELITGEMQVGDGAFDSRAPADVNVAGDLDDTLGPTYATFSSVLDADPVGPGEVITQTLARDGSVGDNEYYAQFDVWGEYLEPTTNHRVADVFWTYLNSSGTVAYDDTLVEDLLFDPWFYATGLPVTEAYWSEVTVAGTVLDVLIQCFERRCMTYTPSNDPGWRVEMGNVGLHYHTWRYDGDAEPVDPDPQEPAEPVVLYESSLQDWPETEFTGGATFVQDEAYHLQATVGDGFTVAQFAPDAGYTEILAEVDVRAVSDSDESEACLIIGANQSLTTGYIFCIDEAGQTVAYQRTTDANGSQVTLILLERAVQAAANPVDEWNRLGILVATDGMTFLVNGQEVGNSGEPSLGAGLVGIAVTNNAASGPAEYAFRDLMIQGPSGSS